MPVVREEDTVTHEVRGSIFRSYVSGRTGSQVCAWRLNVPAAKTGTARNMNTVAKLIEIAKAL